jgi:hypothetical protein
MKHKLISLILASISLAAVAGLPVPGALPKSGNCPSSYVAKGNECEPAKDAKFAVMKSGDCPTDYEADGSYCLAGPGAKLAMLVLRQCSVAVHPSFDHQRLLIHGIFVSFF